jgi:20S proteasome alpha/beta subunit
MTVCIAAMADESRRLVLATDQMLSWDVAPGMPAQYETEDVPKVHEITPSVFALAAGNTVYAFDIVRLTKRRAQELGATSVEQTAEVARLQYQSYRRNLIIRWLLEPRGLDLATYYAEQQTLSPALVQQVDGQLAGFDLDVQMIVAGHDGEECHIYGLFNPGLTTSFDAIGFACVGIGAPHALYYLIGADYRKSLPLDHVDELVREAKAKSEKAPGVGEQTEIIHLPREDRHA